MTDEYNVHDDPLCHTGGWVEESRYECGGTWFVNVRMVAVDPCEYDDETHENLHNGMATHCHRLDITRDCFDFDHEPTSDEVEAEVIATGFEPKKPKAGSPETFVYTGNPTTTDQGIALNADPVKTITDGEESVFEYSRVIHPTEYNELFSMLPITVDDKPTSMCLKGDWIYLYYARAGSPRPEQFFDRDFFLYSIRVHKDTGEVRRKGYNKGLTLTDEEFNSLEGASDLEGIIATGYYLDEPRYAIYYQCSSDPADYVADAAVVEKPYMGDTWENGVKVRTRKYTRESYED
jgi:hypothetical protein